MGQMVGRVQPDVRAAFQAAPVPMLLLAADPPRFTMLLANDAHARAFRVRPEDLEGRGVFEVFPPAPPAATQAFIDNVRASLGRVVKTAAADEMPIMPYAVTGPDGAVQERSWSATNAPVFDPDGELVQIISCVRDVTAEVNERRLEAARSLLMREVDHRARNALTVVQSMIRLTQAEDLRSYRDVLAGRVDALARAQTSLAGRRWEGGDLRELVDQELRALALEDQARVFGPQALLGPEQVQALSMILHELATNACKYGALSRPEGVIAINWTLSGRRLTLTWRELGGPPVAPPARTGFGTRLLQRLGAQIGGEVVQTWDAAGLVMQLAFEV